MLPCEISFFTTLSTSCYRGFGSVDSPQKSSRPAPVGMTQPKARPVRTAERARAAESGMARPGHRQDGYCPFRDFGSGMEQGAPGPQGKWQPACGWRVDHRSTSFLATSSSFPRWAIGNRPSIVAASAGVPEFSPARKRRACGKGRIWGSADRCAVPFLPGRHRHMPRMRSLRSIFAVPPRTAEAMAGDSGGHIVCSKKPRMREGTKRVRPA